MHIFDIWYHYVCTLFFLEQFSISYYVFSKLLIQHFKLILFAGNTPSDTYVLSFYKERKYEDAHV